MKYKDLTGRKYEIENTQDRFLRNLYGSAWGRCLLKPLVNPCVSYAAGYLLDTRLSRLLIQPFIRLYHLDMSEYKKKSYMSYNDFFTRPLKKGMRRIDESENHFISPSDGKISIYSLDENGSFQIKHSLYNVKSLLRNDKLAKKYRQGYAVIIRLCVDDYHRYCYPASGRKSKNVFINGVLHTVNPAACETLPVYKENSREYTLLQTKKFGTILQMEVGALMVGRICNLHGKANVKKGQEKGRFEFGGSTIVLLLEKRHIKLKEELIKNTREGYETLIQMGQCIGEAI